MEKLKQYGRYFDLKRYYRTLKYEPPSVWSYLKESTIINLAGWCPGMVGGLFRNLLYRIIVAKMGTFAFIESGVEIRCASTIEIGKRAIIQRGASLNAYHTNGKLCIRDDAYIDSGVDIRVLTNGYIEIDERTYIAPYVCIAGPGHIKIGKDCLIASHSGIFANNHNFSDPARKIWKQGITCKGIVIEDDCWLGSGVRVLDGVTIGQGSVIGAGAVVTKDIPPYSVAVGVPAKVISKRSKLQSVPETTSEEVAKN